MMRVGVISDTHGSAFGIERALRAIPDAELWIHLGDLTADARTLEKRAGVPVHSVRGNCDFDARVPAERVVTLAGARILLCHGHQYAVRYDRSRLFYRAEELGCALVLYGHTHVSLVEASGAVLAVNPGSPSQPREGRAPSIALLRIEAGEVFPEIMLV